MIFTDRTIIVQKGTSSINDTIILYRGDRDVEIRFTLNEGSPFKFGSGASPNIIEKTEAAYGQLIIKRPNDLPAIFSEIAPTNSGKIVFTITAEMIDEITEVGNYTFQIRLLDESRNSRATIPEVVNGIEIREPIATEDVTTSNEVGEATVGYALTTGTTETLDVFDEHGNYIKTHWGTGDKITAQKLNKMETGIDEVNKKAASGGTGGNVDLSNYVTKETGNANQITFTDGQTFQAKLDAGILKGEKGDTGATGPQGPAGADGLTTSIVLNGVTYTQQDGVITLPNISSGGEVVPVAQVEPAELDMPKVFFYGDALPTTKDNVLLTMDYISNTTKFSSYIKLKCQGNSSMSYAKKNFTVNMYSDEARTTKLKKNFKGWGNQSKFCLKANWIDTTHTRNISGARIAYDMVASRPDSSFKQQLLQCPRNGAVDGFPIKLYFNGEFYGIYTWNIPKDGWMFNMDDSNPNHMVLCAEKNNDSTNTSDDILRCEFRKEWDGTDGNSWSIEFGTYSDALKNNFNRCVNFVMTATDEEFKANIGNYFDLYSLLDYYCFSYLVAHIDGLAKNMLMVTYDGVIWGATLYDMDSIYGADWQGTRFKAANLQCPEQYQETNSLLWQRIENCFSAELYARYLELRQGALSLSNIIKHVEEIYDVIPDRVFADEKAKWTSLPGVNNNTMTRFRNFMRDRAAYVDAQMLEIGTKVPCTGIVLSTDTLSFTTADTQTLSVVVSPTNCTDTVAWSVSPTNIVSVDNGVVTPVSNGTCTITATCGSYSDTCAVTVSLPSVECTGISLDKTELRLGKVAGGATDDSGVNYLDGATWVSGTLNGSAGTSNYSLGNSTTDYRCQLTDLPVGTYTLHHDTYTYKKLGLNDNGIILVGTSANGAPNTNDITFNITNPNTTVDISVYSNANTPSGVILTRTDISDMQQYPFEYTTISSPSWSSNMNDYLVLEFVLGSSIDIDRNKLVNVCIGDDKYYISNATGNASTNVSTISSKCDSIVYQEIVYVDVAVPKSKYGSTLDEFKTYCSNNGITNIYINKDIQNTSETLSAQLTATVSPTNCTQPVVWSVSPEGIVTVNNGLVTAVTNGEATVTATCGTQSANCAVTVSGMSESGGGTDIYATAEYAITEPRTFNGTSDYIDTRIQLFDTAKDFALYIDYTPTAGVTQGNNTTVFHCVHEVSPYRGLCMMLASVDNLYFIGGQSSPKSYAEKISPFDNHKFIIQFANGVISSIKTVNDGVVQDVTLDSTAVNSPYVQVTENLLLGCYQNTSGTKGRFWKGSINKFGVWYKQLTSDEINKLFGI